MSFISDIRAKRQVRAYSNKNEDIIQRYLSKPLARDDLQNIVGMLSHPEIHQPLMKHMDDLLKQPNFDNSLKEQFADRLQKLPQSSQRDAALDRLTTAFEATGSLSDKLRMIKPEDKKPSLQERIRQRIQDTYTAINAQVQRAQDRVNDAKDAAKNRLAEKRDGIVDKVDKMKATGRHRIDDTRERVTNSVFKMQSTVMPAFDMLRDRITKKFDDFRDEYHSRKLTYQNDNNLRAALAKGLDAETLADGIDSMQLPEIRYPMVHNADAILRQKSMTPKLADDFFNAALDYVASLDKKNPLREKFQQAFNDYDARVANQAENTDDKNAKLQKDAIDETPSSVDTRFRGVNAPEAPSDHTLQLNAEEREFWKQKIGYLAFDPRYKGTIPPIEDLVKDFLEHGDEFEKQQKVDQNVEAEHKGINTPETPLDRGLRLHAEDREFEKQQKVAQAFDAQFRGINPPETPLDRKLRLHAEDREFEKQQKVDQNVEAERKQKPDVKNAELTGFDEHGQAEYHFPNGENKSEQAISEMMSTEYSSDYMPPDDLPGQLNDEDQDAAKNRLTEKRSSADAIDEEAFTSGLENLEPPESSLQMSC